LAACYGQGNELERGVKGTTRDRGAKPEGTRNPTC
jgi:hypothetical protein